MKLQKLIQSKKFDYVNSDINEVNFPQPKKLRKGYKLFHFNKYISSEDAVKEMETQGYAPANLYELLSWKDWNDKDWVIALGSACKVLGDRGVPYLDGHGSERGLYLFWWDYGWFAYCRFLGVRNSSSGAKVLGTALGNLDSLSLALGYLDAAEESIKKAKELLKK